jgi:hypothetical protein
MGIAFRNIKTRYDGLKIENNIGEPLFYLAGCLCHDKIRMSFNYEIPI